MLFINEFGRASVPLLSIVSGLLFFRSVGGSTWQTLIAGKVRTLLVPMAAWSAALLLMFVAKSVVESNHEFFDVPVMTWVNRVFAVTAPPINLPLAFLRDIFICCVIGLVASALERRQRWAGMALIVIVTMAEVYTGGSLLLRPTILVFFGLGYGIGVLSPRSLALPWHSVIAVAAVDVLIQFGPFAQPVAWDEEADLFHRFAVAMLIWRIALSIFRQDGMLRRRMEAVEPMIFLVFCSHMLTISVMAVAFRGLDLTVENAWYPLVFAMQIPVVFLAAGAINAIGEGYAPKVLAIVTGRKTRHVAIVGNGLADARKTPTVNPPAG